MCCNVGVDVVLLVGANTGCAVFSRSDVVLISLLYIQASIAVYLCKIYYSTRLRGFICLLG